MNRWLLLSLVLTAIALAAALYVFCGMHDALPDEVPVHWDAHSRPNQFVPRDRVLPYLLILPGAMLGFVGLTLALPWLSPRSFGVGGRPIGDAPRNRSDPKKHATGPGLVLRGSAAGRKLSTWRVAVAALPVVSPWGGAGCRRSISRPLASRRARNARTGDEFSRLADGRGRGDAPDAAAEAKVPHTDAVLRPSPPTPHPRVQGRGEPEG
jgi:hypothetical protein